MQSSTLLVCGFILMLVGFGLPFGMLMGYFPSTFFLNFFAYSASLVGLIMGLLGIALYVRRNRNK
jgi:membrane associated rhomboid family serine protease